MQTTKNLARHISWIKAFVNKPDATALEWKRYDEISRQVGEASRRQEFSAEEKEELITAYGSALTPQTLQGFVFAKPHGYAGDYEIIDRFYTGYTSPDERLAKWDDYLHAFPAVKAVRNRKAYVKNLLREKLTHACSGGSFEMLNLASGPARDLYEFFAENPGAPLSVECIDLDRNAIAYAEKLLGEPRPKVVFHNKNVLRFTTEKQYDLIWSAGLFDYFNDAVFKRLMTRFLRNLKPGGELVVGNFCSSNPDIAYMELLDWVLHHRTADDLIALAMECGVSRNNITIGKEEEGVNLFVHIRKSTAAK